MSVPAIPFDVLSAIQSWWNTNSAINISTSDRRLWLKQAPANVELPYATIFLVSEVAQNWTTSYAQMRSSVQINFAANTPAEARAIAIDIRNTLTRTELLINNQPVAHILPDHTMLSIGDGLGPDGEDCWIASEVFDIVWFT